MKISEMIDCLSDLRDQHGDLEATITDGWEAIGYRGDFGIQLFEWNGEKLADIGVGGCREHEQ